MTVKGSVSKMLGRHIEGVDRMSKECVEDSLKTLAKLAAAFTPVDTGDLARNWKRTPVKKNAKGEYSGRIYNDKHYAAVVEHGSSPHLITPNDKNALYWEGASHPVNKVMHPGTQGAHMTTKAVEAFTVTGEKTRIAESKVRKYLK